jgi:hypothetical protein
MNSPQALAASDWQPVAANANDIEAMGRLETLQAELTAQEAVMSAALLVTTAFRLRDEAGLIETLRRLTNAVAALEDRRASEEG